MVTVAPARFEVRVEDVRALQELIPEWERLLGKSANASVFQAPGWILEWWRVYGRLRRAAVFTARSEDGELVALAPMMIEREYKIAGRPRLRFIGSWASGQHHILIAAGWEEVLAPALYAEMTTRGRNWTSTEFLEMPTPWPALLGATAQAGDAPAVENASPVVALASTWDEYLFQLGGKDRHELKRKMRRSAEGGLTYRRVSGGPGLAQDLRSVLELNRMRWGRQGLWAPTIMAYRRRRRFLEGAVTALAAEGRVAVHLLEKQVVPVAGLLCFELEGTCYAYLTGFDSRFSSLSPGLTIFAEAIRSAIERGITRFNFICGQHDYKYRLGAVDEPLWGWTTASGA